MRIECEECKSMDKSREARINKYFGQLSDKALRWYSLKASSRLSYKDRKWLSNEILDRLAQDEKAGVYLVVAP